MSQSKSNISPREMFRFIESIKYKDGIFYNLPYHQTRMNKTQKQFGYGEINLIKYLEKVTSPGQQGVYKCRVLYAENIGSIEFVPYSVRKKQKVGVVTNNDIDYSYKFTNRENLEKLIAGTGFDDIIIIKNGFVTDALFSNLVFESDEGLFTPTTYLLPGTKRQSLLDIQQIDERHIRLEDISSYPKLRFINVMIDLEDDVFVETGKLIFP